MVLDASNKYLYCDLVSGSLVDSSMRRFSYLLTVVICLMVSAVGLDGLSIQSEDTLVSDFMVFESMYNKVLLPWLVRSK